jgi:predicted O-methyltransferase YrrM
MADAYLSVSSLAYAENYIAEDEATAAARARSAELGCTPIGPAGGAALRVLAALANAKSVVEVGTGAGVSGLWLLAGMRTDGVLTTVDTEPEHQRAAKQAYTEADIASSRYRLINGAAAEVLPRLTDGGYDLVFVDADKTGYADYYEELLPRLRPGGLLLVDNTLWGGAVFDEKDDSDDTLAIRALNDRIAADPRVRVVLLPIGDGLTIAQRL